MSGDIAKGKRLDLFDVFGTSGIRGPVGEDVTAKLALRIGRALGVEADSVVIGRDPRESGSMLMDSLAAGLCESGVDVQDIGLSATPTIARAVRWLDADAGVAITASHNPPPDNGLKLWQPSGRAFDADGQERIARRVEEGIFNLAVWDALGTRTRTDVEARHRESIIEAVSISDPLKVVVDIGNGAGGVTIDILETLGCSVRSLNAHPDGCFPSRPSEPTAEHCSDLIALVSNSDADLGIAHDGDADRLRAVDADGNFLSGDVLLSIFALEASEPGERVAVPVDTSLAVEDTLAESGVDIIRTPVGDVNVAAAAAEPDVAFGGEPSGAWIWPEETLCPDGPLAAAKLAALAAKQPLSEQSTSIQTYPIQRTSIQSSEKHAVMERIRDHLDATFDRVSMLDGVRVDLDDAWFLIRASGTQPLIRVTAEARSGNRTEEVFTRATEIVELAENS